MTHHAEGPPAAFDLGGDLETWVELAVDAERLVVVPI
jgi:hypothetical protein